MTPRFLSTFQIQFKWLMDDLTLLQDLFGNSEETKLLICTVIFCLLFTAPAKWRLELRAKIGHYGNRCFGVIRFQKYKTKGIVTSYLVFSVIVFTNTGYNLFHFTKQVVKH